MDNYCFFNICYFINSLKVFSKESFFMEKIKLSIENINKRYDSCIIFRDFNIDFYVNEVNCIFGKFGCGKIIFLNIISGIIKNDINNLNIKENLNRVGNKFEVSYIF